MPLDIHSEFKLYMEYSGKQVPLVALEMMYAVNTIPQAQLTLPLGRSVKTLQVPDIKGTVDNSGGMVKAKIFLVAKYQRTNTSTWNEDPQVIFEGYIAGYGARQMRGSAYSTLTLIGWLADLQFSSMLSKNLTPSHASPYGYSAVTATSEFPSLASGGTSIPKTYYTSGLYGSGLEAKVQEDVWRGIYASLIDITAGDLLTELDIAAAGTDGTIEGGNDSAVAALGRILRTETPLKLKSGSSSSNGIAKAIATDIGMAPIQELLNSTFWDRIISKFCHSYMFSIVPRAVDALAVPAQPGLRDTFRVSDSTAEHTITADQYDQLQTGGVITQPVRAVIMTMSSDPGAGGVHGPGKENQGVYEPDGAPKTGRVLFSSAPSFMSAKLLSEFDAIKATQKLPSSGVNAPDSQPTDNGIAELEKLKTESAQFSNLYARAMYAQEAARGISMSLSGRLRFDIAPGSVISVQGKAEKFIAEEDIFGSTLVGFVNSVSVNINAESRAASTAFKLSHVRTSEQNATDLFSVAAHPLYENNWPGTYLVEAYA